MKFESFVSRLLIEDNSTKALKRLVSFISSLVFIASLATLAPLSYAQQNADIDAVKQRAALNSAKADLEEARKKRDMAVAARWKRPTRNANSLTKSITKARKRSTP